MSATRPLPRSIAALAALACCCAELLAAPITVDNFSFEADENTNDEGRFGFGEARDFGDDLTAWPRVLGGTSLPAVGWLEIDPTSAHPNPPAGLQESQVLSLRSEGAVLNTTGTPWSSLSAGDVLTLTIGVGMRNQPALDWNEGTFFGLTDSDADFTTVELADTIANSGVIPNNPATGDQTGDGTLVDVAVSYTVQAGDLGRSGPVGILIYSEGVGGGNGSVGAPQNQSFFDNVRLDLARVPEPCGLGLLALAALATSIRGRT